MDNLKSAKYLGGIGLILTFLGFIPYLGWLLPLVGWIMVALALNQVGKTVKDGSILTNFIIALVIGIVGGVVVLISGATAVLPFVTGSPEAMGKGLSAALIVAAIVAYAMVVAHGYFYAKSFRSTGAGLRINLFTTGANLYFWGSLLTVVLGLGFILMLIAEIVLIVAFFSLPETLAATPESPSSSPGIIS
ncbi:DUF996 domain-containing protein [Desulfothermobacter acidiphilus]|uniref:DUF996 domain-containing protein n=1 Tax=Desulfothermobacter acidiphilus TaxID=1938353 RepID=UPI003F8BB3A0